MNPSKNYGPFQQQELKVQTGSFIWNIEQNIQQMYVGMFFFGGVFIMGQLMSYSAPLQIQKPHQGEGKRGSLGPSPALTQMGPRTKYFQFLVDLLPRKVLVNVFCSLPDSQYQSNATKSKIFKYLHPVYLCILSAKSGRIVPVLRKVKRPRVVPGIAALEENANISGRRKNPK